jgi:hypothetical protein
MIPKQNKKKNSIKNKNLCHTYLLSIYQKKNGRTGKHEEQKRELICKESKRGRKERTRK